MHTTQPRTQKDEATKAKEKQALVRKAEGDELIVARASGTGTNQQSATGSTTASTPKRKSAMDAIHGFLALKMDLLQAQVNATRGAQPASHATSHG